MRFWITLTLSIFLLLPLGALAQESVLVDRISSLRLNIERIQDASFAVSTQRDSLAKQHEMLAAQIKDIKENMGESMLPNFPLEAKLRKSHELSNSLTLLNREMEALERARQKRLRKLLRVYDELVQQTAKSARSSSEEKKQQLVKLLARARTERNSVRAQLSSPPSTSNNPNDLELLASDDPEELTERADAICDRQDKLRSELAFVDKRLKELKEEARLDREIQDFVGDQDIFNEGSRVLVLPSSPAPKNVVATDSSPTDNGLNYGGDQNDGQTEGAAGSSIVESPGDLPARTTGGTMQDSTDDPEPQMFSGPNDRSETSDELHKRRARIIKMLKKFQNLHDQLLEHMEELKKE